MGDGFDQATTDPVLMPSSDKVMAPHRHGHWKRSIGRPPTVAVGMALVLINVLGCPSPPPPPVDLELPQAYVAEASGEVDVDGLVFHGHARIDYLISPTDEVNITRLRFWIDDADIVVRGPFGGERRRERLRCTSFAIENPVTGRLNAGSPDKLIVATGAASVVGVSFGERAADRTCPGLARQITATNNADFELVHDPRSDRFEIATTFTGTLDGESVSIRIAMDGSFVNRPPVPLIGIGGPGLPVDSIQGACPPIVGTNPPYTPANDPEGLRVRLLSLASDPDGGTGRSDITREYWLHSDGGPFTLIGTRQLIGPVLFPNGSQNRLVLEVSDRSGARTRKICEFLVQPAPEGGG